MLDTQTGPKHWLNYIRIALVTAVVLLPGCKNKGRHVKVPNTASKATISGEDLQKFMESFDKRGKKAEEKKSPTAEDLLKVVDGMGRHDQDIDCVDMKNGDPFEYYLQFSSTKDPELQIAIMNDIRINKDFFAELDCKIFDEYYFYALNDDVRENWFALADELDEEGVFDLYFILFGLQDGNSEEGKIFLREEILKFAGKINCSSYTGFQLQLILDKLIELGLHEAEKLFTDRLKKLGWWPIDESSGWGPVEYEEES